jgi:hypothetical protein
MEQCMAETVSTQDRLDIMEVYARYGWAFDTGDVEAFLALFTADAKYNLPRGRSFVGPEQIRTYIQGAADSTWAPGRQHHVDQVILVADGERVRGRAYTFGTLTNPADGALSIVFTGYYIDEFTKLDGKWYFSERNFLEWKKEDVAANQETRAMLRRS